MVTRITQIAIHKGPHLDEIAGIWLLRRFGRQRYLGIENATLTIWSFGGGAPDDRSAEEWEREGVLAVGVGLGKLDEHALEGNSTECAATLVAKDLGIDDDPALKQILEYVTRADLTGGNRLWDVQKRLRKLVKQDVGEESRSVSVLKQAAAAVEQVNLDGGNVLWAVPQLIKDLNVLWPDNPERVINWAVSALEARYQQQVRFLKAEQIYREIATEEGVIGKNGRKVRVVTVCSDSDQIKAAAFKNGADVVIQQVLRGNVQIYTRRNADINVGDLARALRFEEQYVRGVVVTTDFEALGEEGTVSGAECWYYHKVGRMLLNGSLSHEEAEPTQILLERIQELVTMVIDVIDFDADFEDDCRKDWCKSSLPDRPCPLFSYGLHRCRHIRFQMHQSATS